MTNATKTLGIIFVILLVLTGMVEWLSGPDSSEAFSKEILSYDPAEVSRVEIDNPNRDYTVVLSRSDTSWTVSSSQTDKQYPANSRLVDSSIRTLNNLKLKAVISRDTSDFTRFKVDQTGGSKVRFYTGNEKVGELIIGSPQFVSRTKFNTYVRPADVEAVYSVEGFVASNIDRDVNSWRDKRVWKINRNAITQVDLLYPADSSFSIMKAEPQKWVSVGDTLDQTKIDRLINQVADFDANDFVDSLTTHSFKDPIYTIKLHLDSGVQKSIRLKPEPAEDSNFYIATATDYPYVFKLNKSTFDNAVLYGREQLLVEAED